MHSNKFDRRKMKFVSLNSDMFGNKMRIWDVVLLWTVYESGLKRKSLGRFIVRRLDNTGPGVNRVTEYIKHLEEKITFNVLLYLFNGQKGKRAFRIVAQSLSQNIKYSLFSTACVYKTEKSMFTLVTFKTFEPCWSKTLTMRLFNLFAFSILTYQ